MKRTALVIALTLATTSAMAAPVFYTHPWGNSVEANLNGKTALLNDHQDQITQNRQAFIATLADHDTRITSNTSALTTKVDKQVFADDQARQDAALKSETTTRTSQVAKLQSGVDQAQATGDYANSRIDVANQNIEANRQASIATLADHDTRITSNTSALTTKVDKQVFADDQARQDAALKSETTTRTSQVAKLQSGVDQAQATGDYANSRIDVANQNIEANRQASIATLADHDTRITSNTSALTTKVDKQVFADDQARQDAALKSETTTRTSQVAKLQSGVDQAQATGDYANSRIDVANQNIEANRQASIATLADHDTRITSNTSALTTKVDKQVFADDQARQDAALKSETTTRTSQVAKLQSGVDQAQATGDYANSRIDVANQNIEANRQASIATLADHDTRITSNTSALTTKVDKQVFADDQARQDAALKSETTTRTSQVAKLQSGVDQAQATGDYANSRIDVANQNIEANRQASIATLADHDTRITSNTSALTTKVDKQVFADDQARQDAALKSETTTRTSQVAKLQSGVDQAQATGDYANSRIDVANQNIEANRQASIATLADHDTRITSNTSALTTKVDKQVFADDQARQDAALKSETTTRTSQVAKLQSGVDQAQATGDYANSRIDVANQNIEANRQASIATLADHDTRITSNTSALTTKVDKQVFADDQARQDAALKSETTTRTSQVAKLQSGVDQAQATGDYANSRIDVANQNIEANRQASIATNKRVAANTAQLANHEQRITTLEQNTSARFSDLNSKIDDNRKRASAGIAGVAAMANIPQVLEHQTFAIGAGAGNTDGESALAVGFSARASQNTVVKASVSNDTQHNFVVGAGVAFGW